MAQQKDCPSCKGRGGFDIDEDSIICGACNGTGEYVAPILAEAPSASANTESDVISALREEVAELRKEVARHRSFVGMHTPLGGDSARF